MIFYLRVNIALLLSPCLTQTHRATNSNPINANLSASSWCFCLLVPTLFMQGQSSRGSSMETGDGSTSSKKLRKPYTITKSRDRWSEVEHERFLDALLMFGRDWKKIEDFVGTKTVIQIRSHAQKYFQKVQASGMMANLPPPRPKRKAAHALQQKTSDSVVPILAFKNCSSASSSLLSACITWDDRSMQTFVNYPSADALYTSDYYPVLPEVEGNTGFGGVATVNYQNNSWAGSSSKPWQTYDVSNVRATHAPNPVAPNFTEVYNFIASMFDPFAKCPMGHFLQKLKKMDPITAKTVLLLVKNLTFNMSNSGFESLGIWLSTSDGNPKTIGMVNGPTLHAHQNTKTIGGINGSTLPRHQIQTV